MMWKALGRIGEGWAGTKSCICKDLEQCIGFSAVYRHCSDGFFPGGVGFNRRDLRGADGVCWDTQPVGEGIFFPGSCRILGVGTVYVTSLENSADVLFGVGVASFIFRRRVAFLFHVVAAYVMCGEILGGFYTFGSGAGCG